jgi:hypothetical protein
MSSVPLDGATCNRHCGLPIFRGAVPSRTWLFEQAERGQARLFGPVSTATAVLPSRPPEVRDWPLASGDSARCGCRSDTGRAEAGRTLDVRLVTDESGRLGTMPLMNGGLHAV